MTRLQARGTLRIVLREAGFEGEVVTARVASTVVSRLLPEALRSRGVADPGPICERIVRELGALAPAPAPTTDTPEDFLHRVTRKR